MPRPEHPRPRLIRGGASDWVCLNGRWEFSFDEENRGRFDRWQNKSLPNFIVVPFAPQWELSCRKLRKPIEISWYARDFEVPAQWPNTETSVLLHSGACKYYLRLRQRRRSRAQSERP